MLGFAAACAWGRAWPSRSRTQGAAFGGAKGKPEELALRARTAPFGRSMRSATRVIQVCGVVESSISREEDAVPQCQPGAPQQGGGRQGAGAQPERR